MARAMAPRAAAALLAAATTAAAAAAVPDPQDVAYRAVSAFIGQPFTANMWEWSYGPAIQMSAAWEMTAAGWPGADWAGVLNDRLDGFITNTSGKAYAILHNITLPWDTAIGDDIGLMPIAYLSRFDALTPNASRGASPDWNIAVTVADRYVLGWPHFLPDGTISRDSGWPGQPDKNASFLWCVRVRVRVWRACGARRGARGRYGGVACGAPPRSGG